MQHIPSFIKWLKYISFVYYGFHLLLKVQYSPDEQYNCSERGGCVSIQTSPSFEGITLKGGAKEACILLAMAIGYRILAYVFLRRRIKLGTWYVRKPLIYLVWSPIGRTLACLYKPLFVRSLPLDKSEYLLALSLLHDFFQNFEMWLYCHCPYSTSFFKILK